MYILTITAKRKNAKRHIVAKSGILELLRNTANVLNRDLYIVEIYNGKWELVEAL